MAFASVLEVVTFIITMFVIIHDYVLYPQVTCARAGDIGESKYHGFEAVKVFFTSFGKNKVNVSSRVVDSAELNVEICEEESESIPPLDTWISKIKLKYFEILSKVTSLFYKATKIEYTGKPLKTEKIVKTDIVIMAAIVIIYAIIAYVLSA